MKWVVANWKMNLTLPEAEVLAGAISSLAEELPGLSIAIAPSLPYLFPIKEKLRFRPKNLLFASQTVAPWAKGAYTGDVAAVQLNGAVDCAIVGHSERRRWHHEAEVVNGQIEQALAYGITPIVCFGELERSSQMSSQIVTDLKRDLHGLNREQVAKCVFAYEPVWAIGSGDTATPSYVQKVVSRVQEWFTTEFDTVPPILYGGSVTADNVPELAKVTAISGFLVGGASLHIKSFSMICRALSEPL